VLVRKEYRPAARGRGFEDLTGELANGNLTADELLRHYCTVVHAQTGSYGETARRLDIDRRTVKSRIDSDLLARLQADAG
jgi:hypothetical protein